MNRQTFRPYPMVTLHLDGLGYLHLWRGSIHVNDNNSLWLKNYKTGESSDVCFQHDADTAYIMETYLDKQQIAYLKKGYSVRTYKIPSGYYDEVDQLW